MDSGMIGVAASRFLFAGMHQVSVLPAACERPQADALAARAYSSCGNPLPSMVKPQSNRRGQRGRGKQWLIGKHIEQTNMVGPAAGDESIPDGVESDARAALGHAILQGAYRSQRRCFGIEGVFFDLATVSFRHQ